MKNKYINHFFYIVSFFIIVLLSLIIFEKIKSNYIAQENSKIFKTIASNFLFKKQTNIIELNKKIYDPEKINIKITPHELVITIQTIDKIQCFNYGNDYIDSYFTSIQFNNELITRKKSISRDIILEKCNKNYNIIILTEYR